MVSALSSATSGIQAALGKFDSAAANIASGTAADMNAAAAKFSGTPTAATSGGFDLAEEMVNMTVARTALKANVNVANATGDIFDSLLKLSAKYK